MLRVEAREIAEALYPEPPSRPAGTSPAERLAASLNPLMLFRAPDGRVYASAELDGHIETWPIRSKHFRGWLERGFYNATRRSPPAHAVAETLGLAATVPPKGRLALVALPKTPPAGVVAA